MAKLQNIWIAIALLAGTAVGQAAPPFGQTASSAAHWQLGEKSKPSNKKPPAAATQRQVAAARPAVPNTPADRQRAERRSIDEPLDQILGSATAGKAGREAMPAYRDDQVRSAANFQVSEVPTVADEPVVPMPEDAPVADVPLEAETVITPEPMLNDGDPAAWDESYWQQPAYEPPAPTCTSGTWFNRGNWYARQDFVYMARVTGDSVKLTADYTLLQPNTGIPYESRYTARSLGFEPGGRLTLGRFLCRDGKNRDHTLEFQFFGLFDWQRSGGITARSEDSLFALLDPFRSTNSQVGGFNSAQSQQWTYDSEYDSYELNYVVAQRLGRDRLELLPNGEWVRKMSSQATSRYIGGVRVMTIGEGFNWLSQADEVRNANGDVTRAAANGHYRVNVQNKLLGLQFGHEMIFQRAKFYFDIRNRVGSFINYATQESDVVIVDPTYGDQDRHEDGTRHDMAFMYDLSVSAAYHLRPNLAVRCGYEFMFLNQIALAPEQLTFTPPPNGRLNNGGAEFFHGFSLGLEMVW